LFERERRAVLDLIEKSETLEGMKHWFQGILENLRGRR